MVLAFRVRDFHPLWSSFPECSPKFLPPFVGGPTTPVAALPQLRFGLLRVRSPLLAQSLLFSSPPGTEMFQFPGFAPCYAWWPASAGRVAPFGNLRVWRVFAPRRSLSQLVTSFFASESQGILHVPLSPFCITINPPPVPLAWVRSSVSFFFYHSSVQNYKVFALQFLLWFDISICSWKNPRSSLPLRKGFTSISSFVSIMSMSSF